MKKIILSVAITGARAPEEGKPARPILPDEIAKEVVAVAKAGASTCHIHAHDYDGEPTYKMEIWTEIDKKVRAALKEANVDIVLNYTTSKGTDEERMAHIRAFKPEMASYDVGTLNWMPNRIFLNDPPFLVKLGDCLTENHVLPEIEIFDGHMIKWALRLRDQGHLQDPLWFQFVLGTYGGLDATVENLVFLRSLLPNGAKWSVTGIGNGSVPMMMAALAMGCDGVRVGMEDNNYMAKGVPATNILQIERAKKIIELANCEVATPAEAREILGL